MALDDVDEPKSTAEVRLHPATAELLGYFVYDHLPEHLQKVSGMCAALAHTMVETLPQGPELTAGLRKLLEAKDCFVRQAVREHREADAARRELDGV